MVVMKGGIVSDTLSMYIELNLLITASCLLCIFFFRNFDIQTSDPELVVKRLSLKVRIQRFVSIL